MMSRSEYWKCKQETGKRYTLALFSVVLCVVLLAGCGEHDRALILELQESVSEDEAARNGETEQDNMQAQNGNRQTEHSVTDGATLALTSEGGVAAQEQDIALIYVHVCGAVISPGVVELCADSRVEDALLAAGGFRADAATDYVNLAARVEDGQQLYFPTLEEVEELAEATTVSLWESRTQESQVQGSDKVNINTAGIELLCTLPGIGEARAQDIIAYRETHGNFQVIEDIMQVSGIKQSVYEKLCDEITVN